MSKIMNQFNFWGKDKQDPKKEELKKDQGKSDKKTQPVPRELMMLVLAAVVVAASGGLVFFSKDSAVPTAAPLKTAPETAQSSKLNALEKELENKIQATIARIEGVGQVQVTVTLETSLKSEYVRNENVTKRTSEETDKESGTRKTTEVNENNQVVIPNGASQPAIVMEARPEIAGVLIVAEGARNAQIREAIHSSARILLNIPASKISVQPMGGV
ncbi:stage III sporulation protein AH [Paradesulfitobacterium ferrireducens]|uniref:stage III sporulation protein AH n=1 Tax=Paradesulfitobacterium ferrireducens TaxID=2816476 RepID=UPI001F252347|nr:stage III sporulation protein AH [Paradesulfitobacterium ferrireducens]